MSGKLKKRIAGNFLANVFAQVITVLAQLANVPLFLAFWGKEQYGEWLIISAIPSYLSLADAGFATFSANEVSMLVSKGDREAARRSLHTACGFLFGISAVILILASVALIIFPWQDWLNISVIKPTEALYTALVLSCYSVLGLWLAIYGTVYRSAYRNARGVGFGNAGRVLELAMMVLAVCLSRSALVLACTMLAGRMITIFVVHLDSRQFASDIQVGLSKFSLLELRRTWRPASMFMAFSLGNAFYFQGLTILTGRMLGPVAVVVFNTTRTLTRVIVQFVTMIKHSVWPEFSYLFGERNLVKARKLNGLAFEVTWLAGVGFAMLLYFLGPWLMSVWTHGRMKVDNQLLFLFLVGAVLQSLWFICSGLLMGTNQHSQLAKWYLASTLLSLVVAIPLIQCFGINGVPWAMIICDSVLVPIALLEMCRLLEQQLWPFLLDALRLKQSLSAFSNYFSKPG